MTNLEMFEYNPEMEGYETGWGAETGYESEVFSEAEVSELASQMLEITNEAELDRFLGDFISNAGRALGTVVRSPIGQAVGGWLKGAAKSALPLAGGGAGWLYRRAARSQNRQRAGFGRWQRPGPRSRDDPRRPRVRRRQEFRENGG